MNLYAIFMPKIARALELRGFPVVKMAPNYKRPQFWVYYFEDSVELRQALSEILPH